MPTAYDRLPYHNRPYVLTHPDHLAVLARLHGLDPAPPERCRVLELGASEGTNLIGMAVTMPDAEFTGVDLARIPIERGLEAIGALGLNNVRLLHADVLDIGPDFGQFDYIIAHGLYAWTPPAVRDKLLSIARVNLNPNGVAFVSYNTYPRGHVRKLLRETMLFHVDGVDDPKIKIERARAILKVVAQPRPESNLFENAMAAEAAEVFALSDSSLLHDFLADIYEPVYFRDFVAHAAQHRLQYLCEANVPAAFRSRLSPEAIASAHDWSAGNRVAEEQYLDLFRSRAFRQTLLCHAEAEVSTVREPSRAVGLFAGCAAKSLGEGVFEAGSSGAGSAVRVTTHHPVANSWIHRLIEEWPRAMPVDADHASLALDLYRAGLIELHTSQGVARPAGDRPEASPLARYQATRGDALVTTLWHRALEVKGDSTREALALLDGTRDRQTLAGAIGVTLPELDAQLAELSFHALLLG